MLTAFDLTPFLKVPGHYLLDVVCDVDTTNIKRPVDPHEAADTTHIIPVIAKLVAPEAVDVAWENVPQSALFLNSCIGESVKIFAVLSFRAKSSSEEKTEVGSRYSVGLGISRIGGDIASSLGLVL